MNIQPTKYTSTMKRTFNIVAGALLVVLATIVISCKDQFTEQDALNAQQQIDLALYIVNQSDPVQGPINGATVIFSQNGVSKTVTTDATGAALFPKIKVGDFIYSVAATNFISTAGTGSASSTNFREGQMTITVAMISTSDADLATVKGTLTVDTDATNLTREVAGAVDVFFDVYLNSGQRTFTIKTDASGNYLMKVPVNSTSTTTIVVRYGDFETNQTIALNQYGDETGSFTTVPQLLPRKDVVKTLFSMSTDGSQYINIPSAFNVRSLYAIVDAAPAAGTLAIINGVTVNSSGQITDVSFLTGGNYTGDADGKVNVTFTSLDGGSGATLQITLGNNSNVQNAYFGLGTGASKVLVGGSGYPTSNFSLNKISTRTPSARTLLTVTKGTITVANGDYGTGIYRPRQIF